MSEDKDEARVIHMVGAQRRLYKSHGDGPLLDFLMKADTGSAVTTVPTSAGHKSHPFNFKEINEFQLQNVHHSTCLKTKVASTVGLGFKKDATEEALDKLCKNGWQGEANKFTEDYWQAGNGYIEAVHRGTGGQITGLVHQPAKDIHIVVDDPILHHYHYELIAADSGRTVLFAEFGDLDAFNQRFRNGQLKETSASQGVLQATSELIHWKRESALSQWYGFPDWLAAVAACELVQALHQHNYDFFINRGVPEFLLFLLGKKIAPDDWAKVEKVLKASVGVGNAFRSGAFNFNDPEIKVQVEKLAMDGKSDASLFTSLSEALSLEIVSAHRVPPLLAGIVIPGKLGSNNELPNALMAFQILVIGPAQRALASLLNNTLGNESRNGGLGLSRGAFEFNKITEEMDLNMMATVGGMRQTLPEAQAQGRDLSAGMKKELEEEAKGLMLGSLFSLALERLNQRKQELAA